MINDVISLIIQFFYYWRFGNRCCLLRSDTWWTVIPKKAAAVAETSIIKEKRLHYRWNLMTYQVWWLAAEVADGDTLYCHIKTKVNCFLKFLIW